MTATAEKDLFWTLPHLSVLISMSVNLEPAIAEREQNARILKALMNAPAMETVVVEAATIFVKDWITNYFLFT